MQLTGTVSVEIGADLISASSIFECSTNYVRNFEVFGLLSSSTGA